MRISWGCVTILSHESTNVRMVLDGFGVILDGLKLLVAAQNIVVILIPKDDKSPSWTMLS